LTGSNRHGVRFLQKHVSLDYKGVHKVWIDFDGLVKAHERSIKITLAVQTYANAVENNRIVVEVGDASQLSKVFEGASEIAQGRRHL
jgi:hypothetical protein